MVSELSERDGDGREFENKAWESRITTCAEAEHFLSPHRSRSAHLGHAAFNGGSGGGGGGESGK